MFSACGFCTDEGGVDWALKTKGREGFEVENSGGWIAETCVWDFLAPGSRSCSQEQKAPLLNLLCSQ